MAKSSSIRIVTMAATLFFAIGLVFIQIPTEMMHEYGSIAAVILLALPAFYGLFRLFGCKRAFYIILALGIFSLVIETIGIYTGFPYSHFEYTLPFGYQLFGTTPWTVFIAWSPMVIGAYFLSRSNDQPPWKQFLIYLLMLVAVDLALDPGAVARGLWSYDGGGLWFGVPIQNFFGWILSGSIAHLILGAVIGKNKTPSLNQKNATWLVAPLILSAALWSGANLSYGIWVPGIIGLILLVWYLQKLEN